MRDVKARIFDRDIVNGLMYLDQAMNLNCIGTIGGDVYPGIAVFPTPYASYRTTSAILR